MKLKDPDKHLYHKFISRFGEEPTAVTVNEIKNTLGCTGLEARNLIAHRMRQKIIKLYKQGNDYKSIADKLNVKRSYVNAILCYYGLRTPKNNQYPQSIPPLFDPNDIITKYLFSNDIQNNNYVVPELQLSPEIRKAVIKLENAPKYYFREDDND